MIFPLLTSTNIRVKLLLDENLDVKLQHRLRPQHEAYSVRELNWQGKQNGELLELLLVNNFGAILTADKNMKHQQNWSKYPIPVLILDAVNNRYESHLPLMSDVLWLLAQPKLAAGVHIIRPEI